jgi:ribosomal protein S10
MQRLNLSGTKRATSCTCSACLPGVDALPLSRSNNRACIRDRLSPLPPPIRVQRPNPVNEDETASNDVHEFLSPLPPPIRVERPVARPTIQSNKIEELEKSNKRLIMLASASQKTVEALKHKQTQYDAMLTYERHRVSELQKQVEELTVSLGYEKRFGSHMQALRNEALTTIDELKDEKYELEAEARDTADREEKLNTLLTLVSEFY